MSSSRPLLMIPGPVEVSPAVEAACAGPPPGHTSTALIEAFGSAIALARDVWCAGPGAQPFIVPGSGTLGMDMAVANLLAPGEYAVLVDTGYFSERMAEMLERRGVRIQRVRREPADAPSVEEVAAAIAAARSDGEPRVLFATHVDTSTGVRVDPQPLAALARDEGMLSVFDGVCATAGERFEMAEWGADVYLTASQKALSLPPGLSLSVVSAAALQARGRLPSPPPMSLDWAPWQPIMEAYEGRRPSYFATPPTNLVNGLAVALGEIVGDRWEAGATVLSGVRARVRRNEAAARAMRAAWTALDLELLPCRAELYPNTLSAIRYPEGVGSELVGAIAQRGVAVAGGLYPTIRGSYFRVGHMGYTVTRPDYLERTVVAVAGALKQSGRRSAGAQQAARALREALAEEGVDLTGT